jgi:hypothetical protein
MKKEAVSMAKIKEKIASGMLGIVIVLTCGDLTLLLFVKRVKWN